MWRYGKAVPDFSSSSCLEEQRTGHCSSWHHWWAMQRGHVWHCAVVPLSHEVFLVLSFPGALCLLPNHMCGSLKLVGWGNWGMGLSGHPRKPFQFSVRLRSLKTATRICNLTFFTFLLFTCTEASFFPVKEKCPFAQHFTDRCCPAMKRCDLMQGSCFQRKTFCDKLRQCQLLDQISPSRMRI